MQSVKVRRITPENNWPCRKGTVLARRRAMRIRRMSYYQLNRGLFYQRTSRGQPQWSSSRRAPLHRRLRPYRRLALRVRNRDGDYRSTSIRPHDAIIKGDTAIWRRFQLRAFHVTVQANVLPTSSRIARRLQRQRVSRFVDQAVEHLAGEQGGESRRRRASASDRQFVCQPGALSRCHQDAHYDDAEKPVDVSERKAAVRCRSSPRRCR